MVWKVVPGENCSSNYLLFINSKRSISIVTSTFSIRMVWSRAHKVIIYHKALCHTVHMTFATYNTIPVFERNIGFAQSKNHKRKKKKHSPLFTSFTNIVYERWVCGYGLECSVIKILCRCWKRRIEYRWHRSNPKGEEQKVNIAYNPNESPLLHKQFCAVLTNQSPKQMQWYSIFIISQ